VIEEYEKLKWVVNDHRSDPSSYLQHPRQVIDELQQARDAFGGTVQELKAARNNFEADLNSFLVTAGARNKAQNKISDIASAISRIERNLAVPVESIPVRGHSQFVNQPVALTSQQPATSHAMSMGPAVAQTTPHAGPSTQPWIDAAGTSHGNVPLSPRRPQRRTRTMPENYSTSLPGWSPMSAGRPSADLSNDAVGYSGGVQRAKRRHRPVIGSEYSASTSNVGGMPSGSNTRQLPSNAGASSSNPAFNVASSSAPYDSSSTAWQGLVPTHPSQFYYPPPAGANPSQQFSTQPYPVLPPQPQQPQSLQAQGDFQYPQSAFSQQQTFLPQPPLSMQYPSSQPQQSDLSQQYAMQPQASPSSTQHLAGLQGLQAQSSASAQPTPTATPYPSTLANWNIYQPRQSGLSQQHAMQPQASSSSTQQQVGLQPQPGSSTQQRVYRAPTRGKTSPPGKGREWER
jgi:hypothetical protein